MQIESALITHLQQFLMEIGKGFACVARQHSISLQILLIFL
ncbi:PDDEXK nuclease domain-containing protein [Chryseobacterium nematophagum]